MRCGRCHGLMVVDFLMDIEDDSGLLWLRAWRCVNCGAVEEPVITRRRLLPSAPELVGSWSEAKAAS